MFHTSPNKIKKGDINTLGVSGSCLFFSDDVYQMSQVSVHVYKAEFDCVHAGELHDEDIIDEIADHFGIAPEIAESLLDASESEWDFEVCDAELSWWLQGKRGECAVKMGFDGCEDRDEQGTVYIVPMLGREDELKLVEVL